jgi:hypothetical protein
MAPEFFASENHPEFVDIQTVNQPAVDIIPGYSESLQFAESVRPDQEQRLKSRFPSAVAGGPSFGGRPGDSPCRRGAVDVALRSGIPDCLAREPRL